MDKGWGLALDTSNNSDKIGFFGNKPVFGFNLSPRLNPASKASMFQTEDHHHQQHQPGGSSVATDDDGEKRVVMGEVDFFSDQKKRPPVVIKKEETHHHHHHLHGEITRPTNFDVNVSNST